MRHVSLMCSGASSGESTCPMVMVVVVILAAARWWWCPGTATLRSTSKVAYLVAAAEIHDIAKHESDFVAGKLVCGLAVVVLLVRVGVCSTGCTLKKIVYFLFVCTGWWGGGWARR